MHVACSASAIGKYFIPITSLLATALGLPETQGLAQQKKARLLQIHAILLQM